MAQLGHQLYAQLSDHGHGIVITQGPSKDQVVHLNVFATQRPYPPEALLDEPERWASRHLAPMLIFTPWRAPPFARRLFWAHPGRSVAVFWAMVFHQRWGGGATFDTNEG